MTNKKLNLQIDFRSGLPIYTQIVNQIQVQVVGGVLKPRILPASFWLIRFCVSLCITSNRLSSFALMCSNSSISRPFIKGTFYLW